MTLKISIPKPLVTPTLPADITPDVDTIKEKFPKIGERIVLLWETAALQSYLNELIFDGRGDREGFPTAIAAALLRIHREHDKLISEDHKNAWQKATY